VSLKLNDDDKIDNDDDDDDGEFILEHMSLCNSARRYVRTYMRRPWSHTSGRPPTTIRLYRT